MDKDIRETLKNLKEMLDIATSEDFNKIKDKFDKLMNEALKQPCKITIEKYKDGKARTGIEGNRLSLLIALAGAEKSILKQLNCDNEEFEFIKNFVGAEETEEANNE